MARRGLLDDIRFLCCCLGRENQHENRPGVLGPVSVEEIKIYGSRDHVQEEPVDGEGRVDEGEGDGPDHNVEGERGSVEEPTPGPSSGVRVDFVEEPTPGPSSGVRADFVEEPTPGPSSGVRADFVEEPTPGPSSGVRADFVDVHDDADHVVEKDGELVVRSVRTVEVDEEVARLSRFGKFRALISSKIIHRLRRLSDEAMHNLNIPEHVQLTRRNARIAQVANWQEREWAACGCCTEGIRCCRKRKNEDRAVYFGPDPEPNPDPPNEENQDSNEEHEEGLRDSQDSEQSAEDNQEEKQ